MNRPTNLRRVPVTARKWAVVETLTDPHGASVQRLVARSDSLEGATAWVCLYGSRPYGATPRDLEIARVMPDGSLAWVE